MKTRQACIKEALRMHPGVGFPLERVVPPACTSIPVCGKEYHVPPGTVVGINPAVVQRDRGVFGPDADVFRPERWFVDEEVAGDEARVRKMERTILAVSVHMDTARHLALTSSLVRSRPPPLHWETHFSHGNGKVCAADPQTLSG
jgi:cytochrome P450